VTFRYAIQTFGCQMNVHDTDRMAGVLRALAALRSKPSSTADLVVLNTCSVRERAEQKLRSELGKLAPLKRARPDMVIAVAGCVAQQEGESGSSSGCATLDLVIGPDNIAELPALALEQWGGSPPHRAHRVRHRRAALPDEGGSEGQEAPVVAFVTTMKGCDERCSFCIVPYTRGPERYRPAREVVNEVSRFVAAGSREVLLLGQTVDSFRDPALPPADPRTDSTALSFPSCCGSSLGRFPDIVGSRRGRPGSRACATRAPIRATRRRPSRAPTPSSMCWLATCTFRFNRAAIACSAA
jgi:tRNA-2-methylthio-N6-dimethylallyladenosine synthase